MYSPRVMPRLSQQQIIENSLRDEREFVEYGMLRNDDLEDLLKLTQRDYRRSKALRIWKGVACGLGIVGGMVLLIWLIVRGH